MKLIEIDKKSGKFRLSMKALLEKPEGWEERAPRAPRREGGNRDNNNRGPRRDDNRGPRRDNNNRGPRRDDNRGQRFEHRNREEQANNEQPQQDGQEVII